MDGFPLYYHVISYLLLPSHPIRIKFNTEFPNLKFPNLEGNWLTGCDKKLNRFFFFKVFSRK